MLKVIQAAVRAEQDLFTSKGKKGKLKYKDAKEDSDSDNEEQSDQSDVEEDKCSTRWKVGKAAGKMVSEGLGARAKGQDGGAGSSPKFCKDT